MKISAFAKLFYLIFRKCRYEKCLAVSMKPVLVDSCKKNCDTNRDKPKFEWGYPLAVTV